jgi:phospholipase D1/2
MNCSWFVDGADFMSAVADAIENAKEEIMIADWFKKYISYLKNLISSILINF